MDLFGAAHRRMGAKQVPLPKIYHTYPTITELDIVKP